MPLCRRAVAQRGRGNLARVGSGGDGRAAACGAGRGGGGFVTGFALYSPDIGPDRPRRLSWPTNGQKSPTNLFGVYETLDYIDTSVTLIKTLFPNAKTVGTIYSQAESQSVDALNKLKEGCSRLGLKLETLPVVNSSETQLITQSLLNKNIDVFFALPDNVIFASFETVAKSCSAKNIPIITSEAGLVSRGALASYGADMYQWGYQSGVQAAKFLKQGNAKDISPEIVKLKSLYLE